MKQNTAGNNQYLKQRNKAQVLDLIRIKGAVSRTRLSELTGLSATAIGLITSELIKNSFIIESGAIESTGGRKRVLLELNPEACFSIGIDFDIENIIIIVIDIKSSTVYENKTPFPKEKKIPEILKEINLKITGILKELQIKKEKLMGAGFSIPGLINSKEKNIIIAPNLNWHNIKLLEFWKDISDLPAFIINEAKASAVCEHWIGSCREKNDFICINIKSGIGAGIFTNGRLLKGMSNFAGEIGHVVVDENGPLCGCGKYGCLETLASTTRIVEKTRRIIRQGADSILNNTPDADNITLDMIIDAAEKNDLTAKNIILDSTRYLAIGISDLVNTLNPEKIVIGKEFVKYSNLVMDQIKKIVSSKALKYPLADLEITASEFGEKTSALGAAIIPLQKIFGRENV
jgi:predicted NBD/HSP70 family sugar kinase